MAGWLPKKAKSAIGILLQWVDSHLTWRLSEEGGHKRRGGYSCWWCRRRRRRWISWWSSSGLHVSWGSSMDVDIHTKWPNTWWRTLWVVGLTTWPGSMLTLAVPWGAWCAGELGLRAACGIGDRKVGEEHKELVGKHRLWSSNLLSDFWCLLIKQLMWFSCSCWKLVNIWQGARRLIQRDSSVVHWGSHQSSVEVIPRPASVLATSRKWKRSRRNGLVLQQGHRLHCTSEI